MWYKRGRDAGGILATYNLGLAMQGTGADKSAVQAIRYVGTAAQGGFDVL